MTRSFFRRDISKNNDALRYDFHPLSFIFHLWSFFPFLYLFIYFLFLFFCFFTNFHRQTNFPIVRFDNWNSSSPQVSSVSRIVIKLSAGIDKTYGVIILLTGHSTPRHAPRWINIKPFDCPRWSKPTVRV